VLGFWTIVANEGMGKARGTVCSGTGGGGYSTLCVERREAGPSGISRERSVFLPAASEKGYGETAVNEAVICAVEDRRVVLPF